MLVIVPWMMSSISSNDDYWHSEDMMTIMMMMNVKDDFYDYHEDNDHETSHSTIICSVLLAITSIMNVLYLCSICLSICMTL